MKSTFLFFIVAAFCLVGFVSTAVACDKKANASNKAGSAIATEPAAQAESKGVPLGFEKKPKVGSKAFARQEDTS